MPRDRPASLSDAIAAAGNSSARVVVGAGAGATWDELAAGCIGDRLAELHGRSVLLATIDQFAAAAALVQLDGSARRIVLYPPDMSRRHLAFVADAAAADVILTDQAELVSLDPRVECIVPCPSTPANKAAGRTSQIETEWVLLTSGTTGLPKLVAHTLASLTGAIELGAPPAAPIVWSTFYDIRRYGGLQIFLRAALTGTSLILPSTEETTADFLIRAGRQGVTHISGTPSHWRRALMNPSAGRIAPAYVRLSGEIADQAILNQLRLQYPAAKIGHAFASTEAGVAFAVDDCLAGVPSDALGHTPGVEMKVEGGTLWIRSDRTASRYLGEKSPTLRDGEGFVDTADVLELRDGRYYFAGRRDGTINVGGLKVHPEEIEGVLNRHPEVVMSLVKRKKSPITGALVVAAVVAKTAQHSGSAAARALEQDILEFCRRELAPHKVPVAINFVPALAMAETGKLLRLHA